MAFTPEQSAIKLTAEQQEKIGTMTHNEILEYMRDVALENSLVVADPFDSTGRLILHPTALADNAPSKVAKVIRLNGVKHVLEADSAAGLLAAENEVYRAALAQPPAAPAAAPAEPPRNDSGQFVTDEEAAALAARSNDRALAKSWADATNDFLNSEAGADWPGGEENQRRLGELLIAQNLVDSPSAETITRAYEHMKRAGMVAENPEIKTMQDRDAAIASATSDEEIRRLAGLDPFRGLDRLYNGENWRP